MGVLTYTPEVRMEGRGFCLGIFCDDKTSTTSAAASTTPTTSATVPTTSETATAAGTTTQATTTSGTTTTSPANSSSTGTPTSLNDLSTSSPATTPSSSTTTTGAATTPAATNAPADQTPAPTPEHSTSILVTHSNGQPITLTSVIHITASGSQPSGSGSGSALQPSQSAASSTVDHSRPFMENKALAGSVFGIGGAALLVFLIVMGTMALRKSRKNKLEEEALAEDLPWPAAAGLGHGAGSLDESEKLPVESRMGDIKRSSSPYVGAGPGMNSSAHGHGYDAEAGAGSRMSSYTHGPGGAPGGQGVPYGGYNAMGAVQSSEYPNYVPAAPMSTESHYAQPQQWAGQGQASQVHLLQNHDGAYTPQSPPGLYGGGADTQSMRSSQYVPQHGGPSPLANPYDTNPYEGSGSRTPGPDSQPAYHPNRPQY